MTNSVHPKKNHIDKSNFANEILISSSGNMITYVKKVEGSNPNTWSFLCQEMSMTFQPCIYSPRNMKKKDFQLDNYNMYFSFSNLFYITILFSFHFLAFSQGFNIDFSPRFSLLYCPLFIKFSFLSKTLFDKNVHFKFL